MADQSRHTATPEHVGTVVGVAYGIVALASSAVAVVVPTIRDHFEVSLATGSWVITAFVVALAATAPTYGRVADRIGSRTPVTVGLVVISVGSVLAAVAPSAWWLLGARAVQGAGAGAIPVLAPTIIASRTTDGGRPRALTRMSAIAAAAAAGLLVGAVISELAGWRPVVALPIVSLALIAPIRRLATSRDAPTTRFHAVGAAAFASIAVGANLVVQFRTNQTTGTAGLVLLVVGLITVAVTWPRTPEPFIPTSVLRRWRAWRLSIAAAAIPAAYFALLIALPTILADRHDYSPIAVGALLLPAALAGAGVGPLDRRLRAHLSGVRIGAVGIALAGMGLLLGGLTADHPAALAVAFGLAAVAFGLGQAALLNEVTAATPPDERGAALALFMIVFFVGGGIGGALLAASPTPPPSPTHWSG